MTELATRRATPAPAPAAALSGADYAALKEQAETIARSGLAPKAVNTPEKVLVIAMKGRELGIPAMQALSHIHVIEGKPTMSAELMVSLVQRAGHKLRVLETSADSCTVQGVRADDPGYKPELTFAIEDAKRAGVTNKGPWKQYPAAMLRARAISALCRFAFADVLSGVSYVPEELGADVDEEGYVVESVPDSESVDELEHEPRKQVEGSEKPRISPKHRLVLQEIGKIYERLPEGRRPDRDQLRGYASLKIGNARAALKDLESRLEEARRENAHDLTQDQHDRIVDLADKLYDEDDVLEGHENLQMEIGKPVAELIFGEARELLNRLEREEDETEKSEVASPVPDDGNGAKGELQATRKQLNHLESLVADIVDDGVPKFEEMVGKRIAELTREEASEWINRLSGKLG